MSTLRYDSGQSIEVGDHVTVWGNVPAVIEMVVGLEDAELYLGEDTPGVMVMESDPKTHFGRLFIPESMFSSEQLIFVSRKEQQL